MSSGVPRNLCPGDPYRLSLPVHPGMTPGILMDFLSKGTLRGDN